MDKGAFCMIEQELRCVIADLAAECRALRAAAREALEAMEMHANQYPHMQKGYTVDAIAMLHRALTP